MGKCEKKYMPEKFRNELEKPAKTLGYLLGNLILTRSTQDSENAIDFVQGPPGSRRERVKKA